MRMRLLLKAVHLDYISSFFRCTHIYKPARTHTRWCMMNVCVAPLEVPPMLSACCTTQTRARFCSMPDGFVFAVVVLRPLALISHARRGLKSKRT